MNLLHLTLKVCVCVFGFIPFDLKLQIWLNSLPMKEQLTWVLRNSKDSSGEDPQLFHFLCNRHKAMTFISESSARRPHYSKTQAVQNGY